MAPIISLCNLGLIASWCCRRCASARRRCTYRPEVVMSLPVRRRTLFRAVNAVNNEYDPAFPASQYGDGGAGAFVRPLQSHIATDAVCSSM
jgi:hypothetical protein